MACDGCSYPMHEQFRNYPGHWYCFCPGPKIGHTICNTPVDDYGDVKAHGKTLKEAKQPK